MDLLIEKRVISRSSPTALVIDLVPITRLAFGCPTGWRTDFAALSWLSWTGGVYKARERIHRGVPITITSDSNFMQSSCSLQSELGRLFGLAPPRGFLRPFCLPL